MHISKVSLINYRNFKNSKFLFSTGINTIIGENASGKTNLFRAIRLLLDNSMRRSAMNLEEMDFARELSNWRGHWIIISLEFEDVSQDEEIQALFLHGLGNLENENIDRATYNLIFRPNKIIRRELSQLELGNHDGLEQILSNIKISDYETVITGKSSADFNDPITYQTLVGDFENVNFPNELNSPSIGGEVPPILSMSNVISFTFVRALRDVVSEFHRNRTNPLLNLLKQKSGEIKQEDFDPITQQAKELNETIGELSDVTNVKNDIVRTVNDTVGDAYSPSSLSIKSNLPEEAEQLFQSLKLAIAESDDGYEGDIHEMSLGGANLIYLTLKLLEFEYQQSNQSIANFLLIEEPEAHIHTHIQKSLFDKVNYPNTQIIYSTHSSHISEVSNIKKVNVIGKVDGQYQAFQPATGLTNPQVGFAQRYLDAIRSNLLFAKSVVLVEGDAEEILIPILIKKALGVSLDELGISLVNIRSTGFENIALLFHNDRIRKKCSIVTDLDDTFFDTSAVATDSEAVRKAKAKAIGSRDTGINRKISLDAFCSDNPWLEVFYAPHTFEVDFIAAGNSRPFISILEDIYKDAGTIATSKTELESGNIEEYGKRALTMANHIGKGWFALVLGKAIDHTTVIPDYIVNAIFFAHGSISDEVLLNILNYHLINVTKDLESSREYVATTHGQDGKWYKDWNAYIQGRQIAIDAFTAELNQFRDKHLDSLQIKSAIVNHFPDDSINSVLARI